MSDTNLFLRQTAYSVAGTDLPEGLTAAEVMDYAGLSNWNLRKTPTFTVDTETGETVPMTGRYAVLRDLPEGGLGFMGEVGKSYVNYQNEEHIGFLETLVEESGSCYRQAGTLRNGNLVYISMQMPGHITIGGVDQVNTQIAALNSHDGSTSFKVMATPIRVACLNMLNSALRGATHTFSMRHTRSITGMVQQAREALELTFSYIDDFQVAANRMIDTSLTDGQFMDIIESNFGVDEDAIASAQTRAQHRLGQMYYLFAEAQTNDNIRGTVWAGYNAITEWADHFSPTRGDDPAKRAQHAILGNETKDKAMSLMMAATV